MSVSSHLLSISFPNLICNSFPTSETYPCQYSFVLLNIFHLASHCFSCTIHSFLVPHLHPYWYLPQNFLFTLAQFSQYSFSICFYLTLSRFQPSTLCLIWLRAFFLIYYLLLPVTSRSFKPTFLSNAVFLYCCTLFSLSFSFSFVHCFSFIKNVIIC